MKIGTPNLWWSLIFSGAAFTYNIFMLLYLSDDSKFKDQMSERNKNFRAFAIVITWITLILLGLGVLGIIIALLTGVSQGSEVSIGSVSISPMKPVDMGWV